MHILYEIEHLSTAGGIERILTDKANYLADVWGWEVTVVVLLEEDAAPFYPLSPRVRVEYLHVHTRGWMMCLQSLWRLDAAVRRLRPDVYVTFQTIGALSCLLRTHRIPVVYESHGVRTCMQHPLAMSVAERYADAVAVLTQGNAQLFGKARRAVVIPNFTYLSTHRQADYSLKHCVAVGRLDDLKNHARMVDLWSKITLSHPDWTLDIYGDGPERSHLEQQIEDLGLAGKVILHGRTSDVVSAYLSGSILLHTSRFEGFGLVIIEAARCRIPTVSLDTPQGPRDLIADGHTGRLIPYDDDDALADAVARLMDDESLRRSMGEAAYRSSMRYMPEPIMNQWKSLFESLAHHAHS